MSTFEEDTVDKCVNDIWDQFDRDKSGYLDKSEARAFIQNSLFELGEVGEFTEDDFQKCFQEFDKDGNGTISKDEMKTFIRIVAGL